MTKERPRKSDPSRSEPIRDWEQLFRRPEADTAEKNGAANGSDSPAEDGANGHSWDDPVSHAVKLGYRIIEEQISQGKRVAEQVSEHSSSSKSIGGDVSEFIRRLLQFYTDIGATCFDFIESLTHSADFTDNVRGWVDEGLAHASRQDGNGPVASHQNLPIEICSAQPARVSLDLAGSSDNRRLGVHGLYGLEPTNAPLLDIEFCYESNQVLPTLRVRIPPDQPTDTYSGVITDTATNQPRGTLCIHIHREDKGSS